MVIIENAEVQPSDIFIDKFSVTVPVGDDVKNHVKKRMLGLLENGYARQRNKGCYRLSIEVDLHDCFDVNLLVQCDPILQINYLRFEYNPVKAGQGHAHQYIDHVCPGGFDYFYNYGVCTRIDATVDVNYLDINTVIFSHPGYSLTSHYFSKGVLETEYIGSLSSPKRFCIYDKIKEIKRKNKKLIIKYPVPNKDITRIEARIMSGIKVNRLHEVPCQFDKLGISVCKYILNKDPTRGFFLDSCRYKGGQSALLSIHDKYMRKKFKLILNDAKPNWWKPNKLWSKWPVEIELLTKYSPGYSLEYHT